MNVRKKAMIQALEKSLGIVMTASKSCGVDRSTHYKWMKSDPEYKEAVEDLEDIGLDFAESSLFRQIASDIPSSTIFYLKTKGKKRGYVESQDINITQGNQKPSWFE